MAQTLETIIAINARVGNGFAEIGSTLTQLGAQIDGISEKLIDFGKDSLKTYEDYEKNMAEARVALATVYGKDSKALDDVMKNLDASAREWASTTIFHTDDVGNAITEAARAGWDYNQIMAGIPAAMELAQAGSIDLSDAIYYITEAAKAGGIAFEDLDGFIDMWAYTANSSNGSIESFGDTMLKLGSVMQFAGSREELLSLIAIMHDTGTEGSTAATLLRTAMMSILAPSGTAGTVLEQLGATEEEIEAIRQDASKIQALDILGEHGFSAFDDAGQAKPILTIFRELGGALADIAGGYENIDKNETTLGVLGTLFGKRGITGALNIINMMERAEELQTELLNGEAEGYGEFAAGTMMDTLYGSLETWQSKVENLELRTGEVLAAQLEPILETVGGIADSIANLDEGTFNAIVAGLEVIAGAGPALLLAGGAFRLIGYALTPAGGIGLGLIALTAAAAAIKELEETDFAEKFGTMELDSSQIQSYVQTISDDFKEAFAQVDEFSRALNDAVTAYTEASGTFKSSLLTDMLTGVELAEGSAEYDSLVALGEKMCQAVEDGVNNNYAATMTSIAQTFGGGTDGEGIDNPIWAQISLVLEQGYQADLDRATELSQQLRNAMTSAFSDGSLTAEEIGNIQSIMDQQNELLAQQVEREHYLERQRIMRRAQTLGIDAVREASEQVETERDAEWEALQDRQAGDYFDVSAWYDKAIENGWMVPNTDGTAGEHAATTEDKYAALAELAANQEQQRYAWGANFSDFLMGVWTEGITSSQLGDTWSAMEELGRSFREAGGVVTNDAAYRYMQGTNPTDSSQAQVYLREMISSLGGYGVLQGYVDYFTEQGNDEMAQRYQLIMDMYDAIGKGDNFGAPIVGARGEGDYSENTGTYDQVKQLLDNAYGEGSGMIPETLAAYMDSQREQGLEPNWEQYFGAGSGTFASFSSAAQASGMSITELIESAFPGGYELQITPVVDESGLDADFDPVPLPIEPRVDDSQDAVSALQDQGVEVQVDGDTQQLQATIDGADGQNLMEYVSGDASSLSMTIQDHNGLTLRENVTGDASSLASVISSYNGRTITVNIQGRKLFASGGRATEASIFGEGDTAEWAIPEEHSENTAALLNAARAASGFTWPEIMGRFGGMNADVKHVPTTLIYSPTIYAQNAEGVEEKLAADKARLEKWLEEKRMMDAMEVYA